MVLDEEALEGMLRRQRESDGDEDTPKAELTDQTEEFEVYERPRSDEDDAEAAPQQATPSNAPDIVTPEEEFEELPGRSDGGHDADGDDPAPDGPVPPTGPPTDPTPSQEMPASTASQEIPAPTEPATPAPEADPSEDLGWEAESDAPAEADPMEDIGWEIPGTADEGGSPPQGVPAQAAPAETVQEDAPEPPPDEAPRRPRVWPPIQGRSHAPTAPPEESGTAGEPAQTTDAGQEAAPASPPTGSEARTGSGGQTLDTGGASGCRLAIIQATFNAEVTDRMAALAAEEAEAAGCDVTQTLQVPGVYDLPLAAQQMARRDDVDAVVVLGAVVQGETQHDLVITQATATSLHRVALDSGKPIGFGVTGPGMTWEEAEARIGNAKHAVQAAVGQWRVLHTA